MYPKQTECKECLLRDTESDNDNPRGTLIWSMRHDPDIVAMLPYLVSPLSTESV